MTNHIHKMVNGVRLPLRSEEVTEANAREAYFESTTKPAQEAETYRRDGITAAAQDLSDRLRTYSSAQIDAYFDGLTPGQARAALAALAKIVVLLRL